jgi:surface-anchored protein
MRLRSRVAILASTLVLGLAAPAQAAPLVVLDKGHVDVVDVEYANGGLELHIHDETVDPGVERDPKDVLLRVLGSARTTVPNDPSYAFLGSSDSPVWILPQVQDPNLLFAGLSTEEITPGALANDQVALQLCAVSGPGKVSLFTTDAVGNPTILFNSRDGLPDTTTLTAGGHKHANWSFTAAGTYRFTFHATARVAGGNEPISSAPFTVTFQVLNP